MHSLIISIMMLAAGSAVVSAISCKQGWHPSQRFNTCYKFVSSGKPWTEAQEECVKQGGNLAVVDTYAKAQNFAAIRRDTGNMDPPKWVGASRESTPRSPYYWVNHQRLINGLWAAGEPNYNNPEPACAYSYKDKAKLYDAPCGNHNGYTCQKSCPEGWHDSKYGTCYKLVSTRTSWDNAQLACERLGGGLAIIDTLGEAEDFATIRRLTGNVNNHYWVGSTQFPSSNSPFHWINCERMANSLWSAGEPNYHVAGRKACAYTYRDVAKLYDAPCGNQNSYACEKAL